MAVQICRTVITGNAPVNDTGLNQPGDFILHRRFRHGLSLLNLVRHEHTDDQTSIIVERANSAAHLPPRTAVVERSKGIRHR